MKVYVVMYEEMDEPSEILSIHKSVDTAIKAALAVKNMMKDWKEQKGFNKNIIKYWGSRMGMKSIDVRMYEIQK